MNTKSVNDFLNSKPIGIDNISHLSPKEKITPPSLIFKKRERLLHLKWLSFVFLTHLLSALLIMGGGENSVEIKTLQVKEGYQILNLPVLNFSTLPTKGEKLEVSIFNEEKGVSLKGYLRNIQEDSLGPTGKKAEIEISQDDLLKVKKAKGVWLVYPSIKESSNTGKEDVYEIRF